MNLKRIAFFILCCISTAAPVLAQEISLNPVTVTATINPVASSQTGRNLTVISGAQFLNLPVQSVDELLRYLPGVESLSRGPKGTQSDFTLRGSTFQQVLVLVDGIRLNDPNTGHFSSYIPIAPAEIDRIEILKGASSALYGSDAVGGVIHIITKTFVGNLSSQHYSNLSAQLLAGEYGYLHTTLGAMHHKNKTSVAAGFTTNHATGQMTRGARGFFHMNTASVSVRQQVGAYWQISLRTAYDYRNFGAQNYYTTSVADTADERIISYWSQLQLLYGKDKDRLRFSAGYKTVDDRFRFNPRTTPNENRSRLLQSTAVYEHSFSGTSMVVAGLQWQNRSIRSNDRGNHAVQQAAAFLQWQQTVGDFLSLVPAIRYDWDARSGSEFIPQLNLSFKREAFQLRGSMGKTIRQADFTERYNNYNRSLVPTGNRVGNPDLTAERSFSYEAGGDLFLLSKLKISTTWFRREHKDLIDYVPTPYAGMPRQENLSPSGNYFLARNMARIQTSGIELDLQHQQKFLNGLHLFTMLGAVWLRTENNVPPSLYISSHARFLANFTCRLAFKRFSFSTTGLYKQRNPQAASAIGAAVSKDYFVVNTRAESQLLRDKLSFIVQVDNLLDRKYSDLLGSEMPGRWLMAGLKLGLK